MPIGTVKFFNAAKGFGFITSDESAKDIFVPATSITAAGMESLKAGQQVSFEIVPDTKGPKAVELKIIAPAPKPPRQEPAPAKSANVLTLYVDPNAAAADEVLAELRRAGQEPLVVDYMVAPPSKEELKRLSLMLRDADQSAVKKYEPLVHALRLDDRFISDGEYWASVFEHPALINGPIIATAFKARLCHSKADAKAFLSLSDSDQPAKRKTLSPALLRLMSGNAAPPPPPKAAAPVEKPQVKVEAPPAKKIMLTVRPKTVKAPVKPKTAAKAKPAPKTAAPKPAKKAVGKAKKR